MIGRAQPAWRNPQILLTLTLVFCCGALAGAVIYKLVSQPVVSAKQAGATWKDSTKDQTLARLKRELQLTPEQAAEIETALDDFSLYYQMLHTQMEEVMATSKSRIDQLLNEQQRKKFSRIMSELKQTR
jgi:uncharacterized membrane protein